MTPIPRNTLMAACIAKSAAKADAEAAKPTAEQIANAAREARNAERNFDSVTGTCRLRGAVRERAVEAARQRRVKARIDLDDLIAAFYA